VVPAQVVDCLVASLPLLLLLARQVALQLQLLSQLPRRISLAPSEQVGDYSEPAHRRHLLCSEIRPHPPQRDHLVHRVVMHQQPMHSPMYLVRRANLQHPLLDHLVHQVAVVQLVDHSLKPPHLLLPPLHSVPLVRARHLPRHRIHLVWDLARVASV